MSIPYEPRSIAWCKDSVCIAFVGGYSLIKLNRSQYYKTSCVLGCWWRSFLARFWWLVLDTWWVCPINAQCLIRLARVYEGTNLLLSYWNCASKFCNNAPSATTKKFYCTVPSDRRRVMAFVNYFLPESKTRNRTRAWRSSLTKGLLWSKIKRQNSSIW